MIPILYSKDETEWTSNGLGRLADASSCVVTEERNGIYELEMTYPMYGVHFSDIQVDCYIKTICSAKHDYQLFRVYSITKPINGKCTIYAHHVSYQMLLIPVMPFTAIGAVQTLEAVKSHAVGDCPFTFQTDNTSTRRYTLPYPKSMRGALQGDQWSILQNFSGDYEWDNFTVKLWVQRGVDKGVILRYGKNITDLKQEENIQQTYTGIVPYWYGMEGENQVLVTLPEVALYAETAANFPYSRILPVDFTDQMSNRPTVDELRERGEYYIERNEIGIPAVTISLNFVDISQTEEYKNLSVESLNMCDIVTVEFSELGISKKAKITRTKYDVLRERYTNLYIGDNYHSIATLIAAQGNVTQEVAQTSKSFITQALEEATKTINGEIIGSSMKILTDADGNPQGIVIMDTDDERTAVNCIRINTNGIGFSNNGVNGPYNSAWTIDGHFNANFITAGILNGDLIRAGIIRSGSGASETYWDLDQNIFYIAAQGGTIQGSDIETESTTQGVRGDVADILQHFVINPDASLEIVTSNGMSITLSQGTVTVKDQASNETIITGTDVTANIIRATENLFIGNHKYIARSNGTNTTLVYVGG